MKILEFFGEPLSYGGQETFILNMYKNFVQDFEYSFITPFLVDNTELIETVLKKGDGIQGYNYPFESRYRKKYIFKTAVFTINEGYDVAHIHSGSIMTLLLVSCVAKYKGIKNIIVHSHATGYNTLSHKIIKKISDFLMEKFADTFLACSENAGEYKFSSKVINSDKFHVIKNGIDLNRFKFDANLRESKRDELSLNNKTVICNIGRFSEEKNHLFLIDILYDYLKIDKAGFLLLIGGDGAIEEIIRRKIERLGLNDNTLIFKNRGDINELLFASDIFVFPSHFEGLGIAAIEAQAAGLPTICSESLPIELRASRLFKSLPLTASSQKWAEEIKKSVISKKINVTEELRNAGYDIRECSYKLEEYYIKR